MSQFQTTTSQSWFSRLGGAIKGIFIGLIIGAILGFLVPSQEWISIFGDMFVGALKGIAPVLVFVLVASSLANAKGGNADRFKVV